MHVCFVYNKYFLKKPLFANVSKYWNVLTTERWSNNARKKLIETLRQFEMPFKTVLNSKDIELTVTSQPDTNANFVPMTQIEAENTDIKFYKHSDHINETPKPLNLEFKGFCIVSMINQQGLLIQGSQDCTFTYKDKSYAFRTLKHAYDFAKEPNKLYF